MTAQVLIKPLNSYADVANVFGVHKETVERWTRKGMFGLVLKVEGTVRITGAAVEALLADHMTDFGAGDGGMRASAPRHDDLGSAKINAPNPGRKQRDERGVGPMRAARLRRDTA